MKKILIIFGSLLIISQLLFSCKKDDVQVYKYENPEKYLKEIDFQGNVLIRKGNDVILRESFGMANEQAGIPNLSSTKFRLGSMSKAFTVHGIVRLKEQGLITSFDQNINEFVDDFPQGDEITLRHLMMHSSGLPDHVSTFEELIIDQNLFFTPVDMFEVVWETVEEDGLQFTPGTKHQYSNANYLFLALLIEKLSGEPYHDYIEESLLTLGMSETHKGDNLITEIDEAKGYTFGMERGEYPMEIAFGSGDWVSNIPNLELWADAWLNNLHTDADKAAVFALPKQDEITEFGMGWFTLRTNGKMTYFHGGDIDGFTSLIVLYPETNGMLIALSNKEDQREKLDEMIELLAKYEF
jgi:CubicO group peptidase (beta-lactamase class C family)